MKKRDDTSLASEMLDDIKGANIRLFIITIIVIVLLSISVGYNIYLLHDIQVVETETIQEITDVESIGDSTIVNGG